ncbi:MAG: PVC-type heme-binding CxxCH protein [Akkermansiaceae bacterium]
MHFWKGILVTVISGNSALGEPTFPQIYNSEPLSDDTLPSASEAAAGFAVPEGFEVSVFAAEPDVQNPIAMTWDERGRIWVAENYTYAERKKRFDFNLSDRVLIFEDTDWDGKADKRTVFIDTVKNLTGLELAHDGLYLMCPPQLLFVPNKNGDDKPDGPPVVILDGFEVAKSNYHNFANGLKWGPDGWLYGRCGHSCPGKLGLPGTPEAERIPMDGGIWRYHPTLEVVEVLTHGTTNPWGHDWDENGELFFINTVNGHLWHMILGAHFKEPFGPSLNPLIYDRLEMHADHWHFDTGQHWTKSRDGNANDFGGGHAHIGMCIYQADHLPEEWRGKLMTWNMHGRRLNREKLARQGSGYVASHEPDQFLASDDWFRGLEISQGPDGALYALDWSDTGECHDSTGVHRTSGRIYRFSHGKPEKPDFSDLENITPESIERLITHPNAWYYRQLYRLFKKEDHTWNTVGPITKFLSGNHPIPHHLRALWLYEKHGEISKESLLTDPDEHLRVWAIRLLTDHWQLDTLHGPRSHPGVEHETLKRLIKMAREDSSGLVHLALASTLQRLPLDQRLPLAQTLASHKKHATDHNLPYLVWFGCYSLGDQLPQFAASTEWPLLLEWSARAVVDQEQKYPKALGALIALAIEHPTKAPHLLKGLRKAYQGRTQAKKPAPWDEFAATQKPEEVADLSALFGDGRSLDSLHRDVLDQSAPLVARQRALRTLIQKNYPKLRETCLPLLSERPINQLALEGLATVPDDDLASILLKNRRHFWGSSSKKITATLITRPAWATILLDHISAGGLSHNAISPYQARQILSFNDPGLTKKLNKVWGTLRTSSEAKLQKIAALKKHFTPEVLAEANLPIGQKLYQTHCAACHKLNGQGGTLGPDLTGSGRTDLDYLLTNIIDPNALVSANHHLTTVTLNDGRTLTGIIVRRTDQILTLRVLEQEENIPTGNIAKLATTQTSIMPEGILENLKPNQQRDLLGYLMKK